VFIVMQVRYVLPPVCSPGAKYFLGSRHSAKGFASYNCRLQTLSFADFGSRLNGERMGESMPTQGRGHGTRRGCGHGIRRLTNAHSKSFKHHAAMTRLFVAWFNFCRYNSAAVRKPRQRWQRVWRQRLDDQGTARECGVRGSNV
jgi:hypothetical protein